ncbi:hypothetical protein [Capnocytophaga sputigena]|uniref:DUF4595 domain-containing protein n=1 Tax=Capnocytophaga sputigena TaxID=1019 RepID=A0A250F2E3_CAPSP|nr:hypothetical protein [Capnocytophaga sputigena]ATA79281.1 hypothetical protein CGC59_06105 [Capnocytophaga sputigena]
MKRFLLSLLALATLVGCNSKDDNTPTPVKPLSEQQQAYLPTKKVKRISCTYIDEDTTTSTNDSNSYLEAELYDQTYTLRTAEYLYEYDNAGRINKVTIKQEGKFEDVRTFTYKDYSVIITGPYDTEVNGEYDVQAVEFGLNAAGNTLGFGMYNEKQQLKSVDNDIITWENDNITKIISKDDREGNKILETVLTYYNNENKNKFNVFSFDSNRERSFMHYFEMPIALIIGASPKNLPKKVITPSSRYNGEIENKIIEFAYTFDSDGFVKNITENEYLRMGTSVRTYYQNSYGTNDATTMSNTLQDLMTKIDNGTVTDKSYKIINNKQNERVIQFTIPIKVEKDSNGKPLNLIVNKICDYKFYYTTENNQKKLWQIQLDIIFKPHLVTYYELHY